MEIVLPAVTEVPVLRGVAPDRLAARAEDNAQVGVLAVIVVVVRVDAEEIVVIAGVAQVDAARAVDPLRRRLSCPNLR